MNDPKDHPVLEVIERALIDDPHTDGVCRGAECVEFYDLRTRRWYEVVVHPVGDDDDDEEQWP